MAIISPNDQELVSTILTEAFNENKSINFVVKQDQKREKRIKKLMEYATKTCIDNREIFLSDEKKACALILLRNRKKPLLRTALRELRLATNVIGIKNIRKTLTRESLIKKHHPAEPYIHLWFIGVLKNKQNLGLGTSLLKQIIQKSDDLNLPILLETSTVKNLPWYKSHGFIIFEKLNLGYDLYLMKKEVSQS